MTNRFKELLEKISYTRHDGKWTLFLGGKDRQYLQVKCSESSEGPWSGRKWFLSEHMCDSEFIRTAFLAIQAAEIHEVQEAFRVNGALVFGPHMDLLKLADHINDIGVNVRKNGMSGF